MKINSFTFNITDSLIEKLNGKKILYIPVISMRDYVTGKYDLMADGNVNRFIHKFSFLNKETKIKISIPKNNINYSEYLWQLTEWYIQPTVSFIPTDCYANNALATRINPEWLKFIDEELKRNKYDIIMFEPNIIGEYDFKNIDVIYWLPVSETVNHKPEFLVNLTKYDLSNIEKYQTIVLSKNQELFFNHKNVLLDNNIFNVEFFKTYLKYFFQDLGDIQNFDNFNLIFNPFRQSDQGYKIKFIYSILEKYKEKFLLFYTAPNSYEEEVNIKKIKISKSRNSYYHTLQLNPYIFYLENPDDIIHTSIFEFAFFDCKLFHLKNSFFENSKFEMQDISELDEIIKNLN